MPKRTAFPAHRKGTRTNPVRRAVVETVESRLLMSAVYHNLSTSNFTQDWSNTGLITTSNDWSGVPSILGFAGSLSPSPTGTASGVNPSTLIGSSATQSVIANNAAPNSATTGAVYEFELANPTIGLVGSNNAAGGSPYIQIHINSTGVTTGVNVAYNVRDVESSGDDAHQQVQLQYRTDPNGTWTNVTSGINAFIDDATTVNTDTKVTAVNATLPADANNQPTLQVRVIDGNATGNDEAVGIDDIVISKVVVASPGTLQFDGSAVRVDEGTSSVSIPVTRTGGSAGAVSATFTTTNGTATAGQDFGILGNSANYTGTVSFAAGQTTANVVIPILNDTIDEFGEGFTVALSAPTGGATVAGPAGPVTIIDEDYFPIATGPFTQNWTDTSQISSNDNWDGVKDIVGYKGDGLASGNSNPQTIVDFAGVSGPVVDVNANLLNADTANTGGVSELELADPTVTLLGSGTNSIAPFLLFQANTTGVSSVDVSYDLRDLTSVADNATPVALQYRVGTSSSFTDLPAAFTADATQGGVIHVSTTLPADAGNQSKVEIRVITADQSGTDEIVGVDNITIQSTPISAGALQFSPIAYNVEEAAGTASLTVVRGGGSSGAVSATYTTSNGTAIAGADYTAVTGTVNFASGQTSAQITIPLINDTNDEVAKTFTVTLSAPAGGATLDPGVAASVKVLDDDYFSLAAGPFDQNWTDTTQISGNDNWDNVLDIVGYRGDGLAVGTGVDPQTITAFAGPDGAVVDVTANQTNPDTFNAGGVVEFEIADPTVALLGSGTAKAPSLLLQMNTTGVSSVGVSYDLRDLTAVADSTTPVALQYRVGTTGDFTNVPAAFITDATTGDVTHVTATLPADAGNQPKVEIRVITSDQGAADEAVGVDNIHVSSNVSTPVATVVGRNIFYNRSAFDGNNASANAQDDTAIATDKSALLPGGTATFANYTSYSRGINGIMVDIQNVPAGNTIDASDFTFKVGNVNDTATWTTAPAPASVLVRPGAGVGGSTRVEITWADNAIQKQWLQVAVGTTRTGLTAPDVFYFGNAIGESGNSAVNAQVTSADEIAARNNPALLTTVANPYDFNRDRNVTSADQIIARNNPATLTALRLIVPTSAAPLAALPSKSTFGDSLISTKTEDDSLVDLLA